jgi:hypothetical protein
MMRWGRLAEAGSEHWESGGGLGSSDVTTVSWARLNGDDGARRFADDVDFVAIVGLVVRTKAGIASVWQQVY